MTHPHDPQVRRDDLNLDPITNEPGAHPIGTGVGAAGGAAAGAAAGIVGGPIGVAVGAVIGAVVGGLAGKGVAEAINPTAEEAYWSDAYRNEAYYDTAYTYDDYGPAYRAGWQARADGHSQWDPVRERWQNEWNASRGSSRLDWDKAEPAAKAAWERANRSYVTQKQE